MAFGSSCSKDFLSVNEVNPNSPSKVNSNLVLPSALNAIATTMNLPRRFDFVYLWHGLWSVSAGYSQPQNLTQYKLINSNYQLAFIELYSAGSNLSSIEKSSTEANDVYYLAIAKIMQAYIFQNLVDCWGDVPYTDAFKAPEQLKPTYTPQQEIYEDLIVQLDAAMKMIQDAPASATPISGGSDIMFAGNMSKWLKFANTLKLRILIHQSDMSGRDSYIRTAIANTASIGYLGAGESALINPGYVISQGKMNPFYETFYNNAGTSQSDGITYYFAGKDAIDFYKGTNDPRIGKFFQPYAPDSYEGNYFGQLPDNLNSASTTSRLGYIVNSDGTEDPTTMIGNGTKSSPMLTDFESIFIQAEAAERGFIAGNVRSLYESAVTQSFLYMGLSVGEAAAYLSQQNADANYLLALEAGNVRELVLTQKWAALNGIAPVEIWTDYRRTGFPQGLIFSVDPARSNDTPPIRLLYPQDELNVNNANVLAVGTINAFTSKIFWQTR